MATFQLDPGPVPLHHQVYLDLRASLDAGEWRSGDQLPTERELAERYGCSLITVRRALGELAREARIERTRGRGHVRDRARRSGWTSAGTLSFAEEMIDQGHDPETRLVASRGRVGRRRRRGRARDRARRADAVRRAPPARRRRTAPPGAGPPAGRSVSGAAERGPRAGSLYDLLAGRYGTRSPRPRVVRAGRSAGPRSPPARPATRTASRSSSRASPTPATACPSSTPVPTSGATGCATTSIGRSPARAGRPR